MRLLQTIHTATEEILKLLRESVIGTPGSGMLYQHKTVETRIAHIKTPLFVTLRTRLSLVGMCCFCFRETVNSGRAFKSFYIRYFSFKEKFRVQQRVSQRERSGELRTEIKMFFEDEQSRVSSVPKYFNYAYVDPGNTRSLLLCKEFGFEEVRRFSTFVFSRVFPTASPAISFSKISSREVQQVRKFLMDRYSDFNMVAFEDLFFEDAYYVVRDPAGKIIAGAHAVPGHWKIYRMDTRANTILLSFLSQMPLVKRLVNHEFRFLAIDALYFTEGCERYTETLLSSLLTKFEHYNAFIPSDMDSPLFRHLQNLNPGLVHRISKQVTTSVICRFTGFSREEIQEFKQHPAYVSALDIT
jgi:hypothetical protein